MPIMVYMCVRTGMYVYVCTYVRACACVHVYACICAACMHASVCVGVCVSETGCFRERLECRQAANGWERLTVHMDDTVQQTRYPR